MIDPRTTFCICDFETTGVNPDVDFPIEVGCIFTDSEFAIKDTYEALVQWDELRGFQAWPESCQGAYPYHQIDYMHYWGNAIPRQDVVDSITRLCDKHGKKRTVTILSDNAQFEFRNMLRLFGERRWPFHYCAWDSSLLLEMTGVGDPEPDHRALRDAALLHRNLIMAKERIEFALKGGD